MFAKACFCSSFLPAHVFSHPSDAAWHLCWLSPSMVSWSTTPASWKTCWWTWLTLRLPRTPNWCCAGLSLSWRRCWLIGCPSACTATSRWGRERICGWLRVEIAVLDPTFLPLAAGNSGRAFLPSAVCNQAADQQGLYRRYNRKGPLHAQWGVAASRERWGQATGLIPSESNFDGVTPI